MPVAATLLAASMLAGSVLAACSSSGGSDGAGATAPTTAAATSTTAKPTGATSAAAAGKVATAAARPSTGCGSGRSGAVREQQGTLLGNRIYLLTTPKQDDGKTPLPLVFDFPGLDETAAIQAKFSGLPAFAQAHGFVVVEPQASANPYFWKVGSGPDNPDVAYLDALVEHLESTRCIDTSRVYATGLSNGAMFTSLLACTRSDRFAAVAAVSGLTHDRTCQPKRRIPVLAFHGTKDPILHFNGGVDLSSVTGAKGTPKPLPAADLDGPGYPATARQWAATDGCSAASSDTDLTATIIERTWSCPAASPVVFEIVRGGGHDWPGSTFSPSIASIVGPTDTSIDANDVIWSFFRRFALP